MSIFDPFLSPSHTWLQPQSLANTANSTSFQYLFNYFLLLSSFRQDMYLHGLLLIQCLSDKWSLMYQLILNWDELWTHNFLGQRINIGQASEMNTMYGLRNGHHLSVAYLSSPFGRNVTRDIRCGSKSPGRSSAAGRRSALHEIASVSASPLRSDT